MEIAAVNIVSVPCEMFLSREMADKEYRFKNDIPGSLITNVWSSPTSNPDRDLKIVEASSDDAA